MNALHVFDPAQGPGPFTVSQLFAVYLANDTQRLAERWRAEVKRLLDLFASAYGHQPAVEIRRGDVLLWLNRHPSWQSDWTRKRTLAAISRPFSWAFKLDLIPRNPVAGLSHPTGANGSAMTREDFQALMRNSDPCFRRLLVFLKFTGARPGEMSALRWLDVDDKRGVAILREHKTSKKTGKPRVIVLCGPALALVRWLQRKAAGGDLGARIFANARGKPWTREALASRMHACRQRGIVSDGVKLYGLRHLFGTEAVLRGVEIKAVAELMGHTTSRTTEERYVHLEGQLGYLHDAMRRALGK